ncbi:metal-dependent hydrolase [Xenophilus sp. Marseille-Q4582]|uniref:metal-dependent hydrolase n=1 Tax=Xenophilus sp. Marseille-Q4582 TaxID=2866600 RepID=UPI001CE3ED3A|nr:metal-dependent hydrolase [Xenophilus sp. Marseille-Q4582]
MDSLTQVVLGGCVAAAAVPPAHRRKALLAGAVLGTLPDLDGIPLALIGADVVTAVTWHRGPSHSLPVLALFGWLVWALLRRMWTPVREAPRPWLWAIWLALLTHPLLDAFTVYGTQLGWPWPSPPVMWASVFIIDPAYTLPLLLAFIGALIAGPRPRGARLVAGGLLLSSLYLGWTLAAKALVDRAADEALAARGLSSAPRLSVPLPLNTLVWRVVVMTPEGYLEGERSLVADRGPMQFQSYASESAALQALAAQPAVARLMWFTHGFMKAEVRGGALIVSDLRMGSEPDYSFRYRIAERAADGRWQPVAVTAVNGPRNAGAQLRRMWHRLWHEPAAR